MPRGGMWDLEKETFSRGMVQRQASSGLSVRALCERHGFRQPTSYL